MRTRNNTTRTLITAFAALTLCCSFTPSADRPDEDLTVYTKAVVTETATGGSRGSVATGEPAISARAALARQGRRGLRLFQYAWTSASIFGRLLSWDTANEAERTVARWLRFLGPSKNSRQPPWTTYTLSTPTNPRKSYADRFLPGRYGTDWQGRMPSLAATMASPYDTTTALDDIERGPDQGVRVGFRVLYPAAPKQGNSPVAFKFVGFGF